MTRERPILMSGEMVRALLEVRKTQTRRVVKVCPKDGGIFVSGRPIIPEKYGAREGVIGHYPRPDGATRGRASYVVYLLDGMGLAWRPYGGSPDVPWPKERIGEVSPYGGPGDRLWVKETWQTCTTPDDRDISQVVYAADHPSGRPGFAEDEWCWRPSIFMPRWASRLTLEVTSVHVERLQEITEEDAKAEGVQPYAAIAPDQRVPGPGFEGARLGDQPHRLPFADLWDRINGRRAPWSSSPWVWCLAFKVITPSVPTRQPEPGEE